MKSVDLNYIKNNYLAFAKVASPVIFIKNEAAHDVALEMLEALLLETQDKKNDKLDGLIQILSHAIEVYEHNQPKYKAFLKALNQKDDDVAVLRLLMDQHDLGVADFPEIGDKSLISKILSGERNLTKNHIKKLAERFAIDPGLFF